METRFTKVGFARAYVLPALFLFVLPAFGAWFGGHAVRSYDERSAITEAGAAELRSQGIDPASIPPLSVACAQGAADEPGAPEWVAGACDDYEQFGWIEAASIKALELGALSVLVIFICAALSFLSPTMQYLSFAAGWHFLRVATALQILLQGFVAVLLSYWCTALWLERFSPKLIFVVGFVAIAAVGALVMAVFKRIDGTLPVEGELIDEKRSPALWARVRDICRKLGTEAPDQIVAGIDDNFFVTENDVALGGRTLSGRTLFVSLSLLKTLERGEADAVLAHEMAHFSGGDTASSKKLSPLLRKYGAYVDTLYQSGIARPVAYSMILYYRLFQLSLGRSSRAREHLADRSAADVTSPRQVAEALLKTHAYSTYRTRVERELLAHDRTHTELAIAQRVASGFVSYVTGDDLPRDLHAARSPHPFDSHPLLFDRVRALDVAIEAKDYASILGAPVERSWFAEIEDAAATETKLWKTYEERFARFHETDLAYRYLPSTDEERAFVQRLFPDVEIAGKDGASLKITYDRIESSDWAVAALFDEIAKATFQERFFKKYLDLELTHGERKSIAIGKLDITDQALGALYRKYYGRHVIARQRRG